MAEPGAKSECLVNKVKNCIKLGYVFTKTRGIARSSNVGDNRRIRLVEDHQD